jgi:HEAT repeat protein
MALQVRPDDPGLTQMLIDSMTTGRRDEASQSVWTLGRLGTEASRKALVAAATGTDVNLAQAAIGALAQNGSSAEVRATLLAVARDGSPQVKGQAVQQLLQSGAPEGLELAEQALAGKDADLARTVIWGLTSNGSADSARLLGRAAGSTDPQIRTAAAQAMANVGDAASTDALLGLARDDDSQVRNAALSALGQIGSAKAVDAILTVTATGKPEDRSSAMYALAQLDDPRATDAMVRMINDPDDSVASTAIGASYNGGAAIDRALIGVIGNSNLDLSRRNQAAQQLRSRGVAVDDATKAAIDELLGGENTDGNGRYYRYGGDWIE